MLKKWLREPLIYFLLIGAALFLLYGLQNAGFDDQNKRIVFTKADINRLVLRWEKMRQRPPTQVELNGMIEQQIREQVMYREALAMGLDKNDGIVRKRLAQKVEFITADLAEQLAQKTRMKVYKPHADNLHAYAKRATRLDWILISDELEFTSYQVIPDVISDHLAVVAEIKLVK